MADELPTSIPNEWQERFVIKRIDEDDITITLQERNAILEALNRGVKFVQIGKYTIMLNAIKSIDPVYEPDNIPSRPTEKMAIEGSGFKVVNQKIIDLWDKLYGQKVLSEK